ncbi:MAG: hypothetical protein LC808_05025 [Actinobacteria bacterium]|nr:hypothetical protein [Actinomycetota bacterium]
MADGLEAPGSAEELYLARSDEVALERPLLTGDVLAGVEIPGLDDGGRLAVIITHPCSMRADGVNLVERLLVARVDPATPITFHQWRAGHYKIMPLPSLRPSTTESFSAHFDKIGLVRSESIVLAERIACLSPLGINLLQQRLIFYLTRLAVPTFRLNEVCIAVFEEADLQEEWVMDAVEHGVEASVAAGEFHEWLRSSDGTGMTRQEQLTDEQRRAGIRRDVRKEVERRRG